MKTLRFLLPLLCTAPLFAFDWPGGTMTVPVTFRGAEVFAGWVPSSPWGSVAFVRDPVVELRNNQNDVVAEFTLTGGAMDWYEGGTRSGVATFTVPGGTYTITTRQGRRLVRIQGEGFSGFALNEESVTLPGPTNRPPTIAWTSAPANVANNQIYTVSVEARDEDGNLAAVSIWKDGNPFAFAGGGDGTNGLSSNPASDAGPRMVTFTARAFDANGEASVWLSHVVTIEAPTNQVPAIALLSPGNQTVPVGTTLAITSHATDADGNITGHNLDIQRPAGDWNYLGGFATGEPYQGGPVGSGADSTRSATFTFTDVGTYYVRSAADDGSGWQHSETVAVTVLPPPPQYALTVTAGTGGSAVGGGLYTGGASAVISAAPDATHDFTGWSGDAGGMANPLTVLMERAKTVQANFAPRLYALATSATSGGSVTPGGSYPYGTSVTISAVPDAFHRFVGWSGDASGTTTSVLVTLTRALDVQAVFADKRAQRIDFLLPGSVPVGSAPLDLSATASSGLPVGFGVVSGPASLAGGRLTVTGPGQIVVQATQPGDGEFLPATPVNRTFNAVAAAVLRYRPVARTTLHGSDTSSGPLVLERP